jgi:hypothetical protein
VWIGLDMWFTVSSSPTSLLFWEQGIDEDIDDPNWDPAKFNILDAKAAIDQNPFDIQTWNGDLSAFKNRGGKVRLFALFLPLSPSFLFAQTRH